MHPGASLAAAISLPLLVAFAGSLVTRDALKPGGWYAKLRKPSWTPPNRVFPVVWSALYVAMGVASHLVWQSGGGGVPLLVYAGYLITNSLWSPLFFGLKAVKLALADILLNLVAAAACVGAFLPRALWPSSNPLCVQSPSTQSTTKHLS